MDSTMIEHWDEIYEALDADELTWYEKIPESSIKLLSKCNIKKDEPILPNFTPAYRTTIIRNAYFMDA